MSEPKFTPGPWKISTSLSGEEAAIIDSESGAQFSGSVCQLFKQLRSKDPEGEKLANAKLIAAAPDLLKVAVEALDFICAHNHYVAADIMTKLQTTIERAVK